MFSIRFNRWTIAAFAFTALALPGSLSAQTPDHPADNSAQFPSSHDMKSLTTSGSYLAARHASVERDANSAAAFYRSALAPIRRTTNCSIARSFPRSPTATSTRPSSSPIAS
jgi:hypothetical protein